VFLTLILPTIGIIYELSLSGINSQELWDNAITLLFSIISGICISTLIKNVDSYDLFKKFIIHPDPDQSNGRYKGWPNQPL